MTSRPPYAGTKYPRLAEIPGFNTRISQGWEARTTMPHLVSGAAEAAHRHRERLYEAMPTNSTFVLYSGLAPVRNDDCDYKFRANSTFIWLLGTQVEDAYLVLHKGADVHDTRTTLAMPEPFRPGDLGFFSNAAHGELWVGSSPGVEDWKDALGIDVVARDGFESVNGLHGARAAASVPTDLVSRFSMIADGYIDKIVSNLRMVKDDWEIAQLRNAVDHTVEGFRATAAELPGAIENGLGERWLEGTFYRYARTTGNDVGYATIVGSGANAAKLHWTRCDSPIDPGAQVLLDMGVEENSFYTADVTRTIPASGTFSEVQKKVHDLVEKSHLAALEHIRPGVEYLDFHFAAMEVLAQGLKDWGLLDVSVDEALSPTGQQHRRYIVCGVGHHLGLDVHDCSHSEYKDYMGAPLEPGVVMTVEPGLYFHDNDLTVPPELRGIGVRIEDDVLLTGTGHDVLSDGLPINATELEAWTHASFGREQA